jgi:hypothetical protein
MKEPIDLSDDVGDVDHATEKEISFINGTTLRPGDRVRMPPITGGILGVVDSISMEFDPEKLEAMIVLRIVDDEGQGHRFEFDA